MASCDGSEHPQAGRGLTPILFGRFRVSSGPYLRAKSGRPPNRAHEIGGERAGSFGWRRACRLIARKDADRVTLWTRHGTDFTDRLSRIAEAVRSLLVPNG
jgi:hypothetical protein